MGVSTECWRSRIGGFRPRVRYSTPTTICPTLLAMLIPGHAPTDLLTLTALFLSTLLLLCGDVESNPGPNTRDSDRSPSTIPATDRSPSTMPATDRSPPTIPHADNWHYVECLERCQTFLEKEFSIRTQVDDLAADLHCGDHPNEYITYSDRQRVKETVITEDKMNVLMTRLIDHNRADMEKAFRFLLIKLSQSGRPDLSDYVIADLETVRTTEKPTAETMVELVTRMQAQCMDMRPSEVKQAWTTVLEYLRCGGAATGRGGHTSQAADSSLGAVAAASSKVPSQPERVGRRKSVRNDDISAGSDGLDTAPVTEQSATVTAPESNVNTDLLDACRTANVDHVTDLLSNDTVDVNVRDAEGRTPLMLALLTGNVQVIGTLLDHPQIDLTITDSDGFAWLMYIYGKEFVRYLYLLTMLMENINKAKEEDYMFELDIATAMDNIAQIRESLDYEQIKKVVSCLLEKDNIDNIDVVKACLLAGNEDIVTLVLAHTVAKHKRKEYGVVKQLVSRQPNQRSMSYMREVSAVLRLSSGTSIYDHKDMNKYSYSVITTINPSITKVLIESRVIKVQELSSAQIDAIVESVVRHNDPDLCEYMIGVVNTFPVNNTLKTVMRIQSMKPNLLSDMLDINAFDLTVTDQVGNTVAMSLCHYGGYDTVSQLLSHSHSVDFSARNSHGQSCLMLSFTNKDKRVPTLLLAHPKLFDVNVVDNKTYSTLMYAVRRGCVVDVRSILTNSDLDINVKNSSGNTALGEAASRGMLFVHSCDLSDDVESSDRHELNLEPLIQKAKGDNYDMVVAILQYGKYVNVNIADDEGWTALNSSCRYGTEGMVTRLLEVPGIDVNVASTDGWTALMIACRYGTEGMVTRLLEVPGIDVNAAKTDGWTALMMACRYGTEGMVTRLLEVPGIDVNATQRNGWTALMFACRHGTEGMVTRLLEVRGIDVNATDTDGWTALMMACRYSTEGMVTRLLEVPGIDVNATHTDGWTALTLACQYGTDGMVTRLLEVPGIDVNAADTDGWTALMLACGHGTEGMVTRLLEVPGIDVNATHTNGCTALMLACESGTEGMVTRLLGVRGIDVNVATAEVWTALMYACQYGTEGIVIRLLDVPAIVVNVADSDGWTALMYACQYGTGGMVTRLLEVPGIDVNAANTDARTALMLACRHGTEGMVEGLLQVDGININAVSSDGATAIMQGCIAGNFEVVSLMLQNNADTTLTDCNSKSAVDWANDDGHTDIATLISSKHKPST